MEYTFKFRERLSPGGLAADLTAEKLVMNSRPADTVQIYRKVWLSPPDGTHWKDLAWLCFGLSLHSEQLSLAHPDGLLISIRNLSYPLSDYRSEVAAFAMDGWVREVFRLPDSGIRVVKKSDGALDSFDWAGRDPFSDPL
ncbi:hypothetical protein ACFXJ5_05020 [Streptomyces sp. NPDC059373]